MHIKLTHLASHRRFSCFLEGKTGENTSFGLTMHVIFRVEQDESSGAGAGAGVAAGVTAGNLCDAGTGVEADESVDMPGMNM